MDPGCSISFIDDAGVEREVLRGSGMVLVHVGAGHCHECPSASAVAGWAGRPCRTRCYCLDGKRFAALAERFSVTRFPTFLLFRDGAVVRRLIGEPLPDCLDLIVRMASR